MLMIAVTMASPFTLVIMSRTNARSIFRQSIGRFLRYARLEYPVPKSSMDTGTPSARSPRITPRWRSLPSTMALSVSSTWIMRTSMPAVAAACATRFVMSWRSNWRAETLTDTGTGSAPLSCHRRIWSAHMVQHELAELRDEAGLLGDVDEDRRRHEPARRMAPAHEGLEPLELVGAQVDDRLVVHVELVLAQGGAHRVLDREPLVDARVHAAREDAMRIATTVLRLVERDIRVLEQHFVIGAVIGIHADADAARDRDLLPSTSNVRTELFPYAARDRARRVTSRTPVAMRTNSSRAHANHEIRCRDRCAQPIRHPLQQSVAAAMAMEIVDLLEVVDVEIEERHRALGALGLLDDVGRAVPAAPGD